MNDRIFTPLFGFVLGFISWESFQSVLYSLIIAFLGGIVAWIAKFFCNWFYGKFKTKTKRDEKTTG